MATVMGLGTAVALVELSAVGMHTEAATTIVYEALSSFG